MTLLDKIVLINSDNRLYTVKLSWNEHLRNWYLERDWVDHKNVSQHIGFTFMKEVDVITQVFSTIKILEKRGYSVNRKNNYAKSPLDKLNIKVRVSVSNLTRKSSFEWL